MLLSQSVFVLGCFETWKQVKNLKAHVFGNGPNKGQTPWLVLKRWSLKSCRTGVKGRKGDGHGGGSVDGSKLGHVKAHCPVGFCCGCESGKFECRDRWIDR